MMRSVLDITMEPVPCETLAWGRVYVRQAMASELEQILAIIDDHKGSDRLIRLVALGACNESGQRLFGESDLPKLKAAPLAPISELAVAFLDANGLGEGGPDEKKSSRPQSGSCSTSPFPSVARTPR